MPLLLQKQLLSASIHIGANIIPGVVLVVLVGI